MTGILFSHIAKQQVRSILCVALSGLTLNAWAAYPDKPIKIIVPWATGGATDQVGRMLAQPLSQALGVPVIVENKAGAGGVIGTQQFVKEKADGYTLLLATSSTNAAAPYLYSKLGFDPIADFTPVVSLCSIPNVMVVPTKSPWNSLKDIVDAAAKSPGNFTYGSAGIGGSQHLAGAQFKTTANIDIRHVPYKGSGPAAQDLVAGHIDMMIDTGSLGSIRGVAQCAHVQRSWCAHGGFCLVRRRVASRGSCGCGQPSQHRNQQDFEHQRDQQQVSRNGC